MKPKIILFNGPPFCGKDTAAKLTLDVLVAQGYIAHLIKFASPLKKGLAAFLNLSDDDYYRYFETPAKDIKSPVFGNKTPRMALIDLSERWAKKFFNKDVFGWLAVRTMERFALADVFVFSDSGFQSEFDYIYNCYVHSTEFLIFHMYRKGCSFKGDSRNYIDTRDAETILLTNNGSLNDLRNSLTAALRFGD